MNITVDTFRTEIDAAVKNYDRYVVCLHKTSDEFEAILVSLVQKAIRAYETRPIGGRHGTALDKEVTVILSQVDERHPLCGIYFNLHSGYFTKQQSDLNVIKTTRSIEPDVKQNTL